MPEHPWDEPARDERPRFDAAWEPAAGDAEWEPALGDADARPSGAREPADEGWRGPDPRAERPARGVGGRFDRRPERPSFDRERRFDRRGPRPPSPGRPQAPAAVTLGPDEELVAGRRPVEEAFVARREARRLLVVPQRRMALEKLVLHAASLRIPVVEVEGGSLTAISGFDGHQGVALVVAPRRWADPDDILALAAQRGEAPFVLVLDSLEDPQNVGTLLRTAEASGVHGAVFPTHRQAPLTPAAIKASAGAVEHLRLAPVDDLPGALADLHIRGLRIVGADGDAPLTAREADLRGPVAIVVGSEGRGLGPAVRRRCDLLVRIPMHGRIDSLNAAVAGSILLYEAAAQRGLPDAGPRAAEEVDATAADSAAQDAVPGEVEARVAGAEPASPPVAVATGQHADAGGGRAADADDAPPAGGATAEREPKTPARRARRGAASSTPKAAGRTRRSAPASDAAPLSGPAGADVEADELLPGGPDVAAIPPDEAAPSGVQRPRSRGRGGAAEGGGTSEAPSSDAPPTPTPPDVEEPGSIPSSVLDQAGDGQGRRAALKRPDQ